MAHPQISVVCSAMHTIMATGGQEGGRVQRCSIKQSGTVVRPDGFLARVMGLLPKLQGQNPNPQSTVHTWMLVPNALRKAAAVSETSRL